MDAILALLAIFIVLGSISTMAGKPELFSKPVRISQVGYSTVNSLEKIGAFDAAIASYIRYLSLNESEPSLAEEELNKSKEVLKKEIEALLGEGFNYSISIANDSQRFILVSKGNESRAKDVYSFEKSLAQYETGYLGMAYYTGNPAGLYVIDEKNDTPVIVGEPDPICDPIIHQLCIHFKTFTSVVNFTVPGNKVFSILYFDVERHRSMEVKVNGQQAYKINILNWTYWKLFIF
ncbi:MAG: hypothetical protein DRN25_04070, partial [Thermoplasmata archaeon]